MNAQPRTESLRSSPSGPRSSATESWLPRSASGSNSRPPGASWATHSGRTSELPTVSTMRSYGAPGGCPSAPSAQTSRTPVTPAAARCRPADSISSASMSTAVTAPVAPTIRASSAAL